jgi:hypothetical protein
MLDLFIRGKEVYLKYLLRNHFYSKKAIESMQTAPLTYKRMHYENNLGITKIAWIS